MLAKNIENRNGGISPMLTNAHKIDIAKCIYKYSAYVCIHANHPGEKCKRNYELFRYYKQKLN